MRPLIVLFVASLYVAFLVSPCSARDPSYAKCASFPLDWGCECKIYRWLDREYCAQVDEEVQAQLEFFEKELAPLRKDNRRTASTKLTLYKEFKVPARVQPRASPKAKVKSSPPKAESKSQSPLSERVIARHLAYGNNEILIVHGQYDSGSVAICRDISLECEKIREALASLASRPLPDGFDGWKLEIWGLADVSGIPDAQNYVSNATWQRCKRLSFLGNDCIAFARAIDIHKELMPYYRKQLIRQVRETIDPDPFMRGVNSRLGNRLFKDLDVGAKVDRLMEILGIHSTWSPKQIRGNEKVQKTLKERITADELSLFRSVVIIVEPCMNKPVDGHASVKSSGCGLI